MRAKARRFSEVPSTRGVERAGFRRSSHLASEAVASKRLGGATTAKVGAGSCAKAVAVRAAGGLYALVALTMHMLPFLGFMGASSSGRVVSGCCEGAEWHTAGLKRGETSVSCRGHRHRFRVSWHLHWSMWNFHPDGPITNQQPGPRAESSDVAA